MRKSKIQIISLVVLCFFSINVYSQRQKSATSSNKNTRVDKIIEKFKTPSEKHILVAAHRGDWRNAPENSLQGFQYCIDMGIDIIELDVQETADGQLIVMHDKSVDRTTKAKGLVKSWTLDSIKTLRLVSGNGIVTPNKIPTLEETLTLCKGKIMVNIDKGYPYFEQCLAVAQKTGTMNQIIMKGKVSRQKVESKYSRYLDSVNFMHMVKIDEQGAEETINDYMEHRKPIAFEISIPSDTLRLIKKFKEIRQQGTNIWVNALWPALCGGHDDEKAVLDNSVYDWFIKNNVTVIQTDRPQVLLNYLRKKGLHN